MNAGEYQEKRKALLASIDRLRAIRDDITTNDAVFVSTLPLDARQRMHVLDREASRLRNPDLTIAFVGGFSAGKSSLVNAFLGRYLLPESTKVTTAVPTFVRSTEGSEGAELHYLNEAEFSALGDMYRAELATTFGIAEIQSMPFKTLVEQVTPLANEGRGRRLLDQFKRYYEHRHESPVEPRGRVVSVSLSEAQDKIRDEAEAMFLDRVVMKIRSPGMPQDIVLVDLPGVSVPNPRHRQITFRFVKQDAHAVVFVLMATRLFDQDEMEVMDLFRTGESRIAEKTFWVLNRWDALSPQQQRQTITDFDAKIQEFGMPRTPRCYRTNALHGLLSQLGMRDQQPDDLALQPHIKDYEEALPVRYDDSHQTAFRESQIPLLQEQVLSFLNTELRQTTLSSAVENSRVGFIEPLPYHLRRSKDDDDKLIRDDLVRKQKEVSRQRVDDRFAERLEAIKDLLRELRNDVAVKRSEILRERTKELVEELRSRIADGNETDAYQVYQDIIAGRELRKYPYHFEIEMYIVDSLNAMLKRSFRQIVRGQIDAVFQDLTAKTQEALEQVRKDVEYSPHVMAPFDAILREEAASFGDRVDGVVMTLAAQLDELLLYKPKTFLGFIGGNEILEGLEEAARMGLENLKKPGQAIVQNDFVAKTAKIRETLTQHYIEKVREYHERITQDIFPIVINNMQQIETRIVESMNSRYRPALETVVSGEMEGEFAERRKSIEARSRRFRELIEEIDRVAKDMERVLSDGAPSGETRAVHPRTAEGAEPVSTPHA